MNSGIWPLDEVTARVSSIKKGQEPYHEPFKHGSMRLGMYAPRDEDPQSPHSQDELYFIVRGTGIFIHGDERSTFKSGDALFVAAGVDHRFVEMSDDFYAWVVFWGKAGGELPL